MAKTTSVEKKPKKITKEKRLMTLLIRQIAVFALSLGIVIATVLFGFNIFYRELLRPVELQNPAEVVIEIPTGSSLARIADILYRNI